MDSYKLLSVSAQSPTSRFNFTLMLPSDKKWWKILTASYANGKFDLSGNVWAEVGVCIGAHHGHSQDVF
eukprot:863771-Karenia_brevis.AAC.1